MCVAKVEHAEMIGNQCSRAHSGGVVFRKFGGEVFWCSSCMLFRTMKRGRGAHGIHVGANGVGSSASGSSEKGKGRLEGGAHDLCTAVQAACVPNLDVVQPA